MTDDEFLPDRIPTSPVFIKVAAEAKRNKNGVHKTDEGVFKHVAKVNEAYEVMK